MKTRQSIWLTEYEGLVPLRARDPQPTRGGQAESRFDTAPDPVSPQFEPTPFDPVNATPTAFLE